MLTSKYLSAIIGGWLCPSMCGPLYEWFSSQVFRYAFLLDKLIPHNIRMLFHFRLHQSDSFFSYSVSHQWHINEASTVDLMMARIKANPENISWQLTLTDFYKSHFTRVSNPPKHTFGFIISYTSRHITAIVLNDVYMGSILISRVLISAFPNLSLIPVMFHNSICFSFTPTLVLHNDVVASGKVKLWIGSGNYHFKHAYCFTYS